jgi:mannan endo-1,4-beta-mannosidase
MPESDKGENPPAVDGVDSEGGTETVRPRRERVSRRRLLGATGLAFVTSLAGCPGGGDSTDTPEPTDAATPTATQSPTASPTDAPTATSPPTETPTDTPTETPTESDTPTETDTPTYDMEPVFDEFVETDGTDFVVGGESFYPVGGNHPQLRKQSEGQQLAWFDEWSESVPSTNVLRAVAFGTGTETPTDPLQPSRGRPGEAAFEKLDRLIAHAGEQGVRLILPLANYWDWMGGIPKYLEWAGLENKHEFYSDENCQRWYRSHIENVLTRTNTYTGIEYRNDPTIMMWELCNEPSVDFEARDEETLGAFYDWVQESAAYIKDLDSNHLVSTGMADPYPWDSEELNRRAHEQDAIDAYSVHLWADPEHSDIGIQHGKDRITRHATHANELGMPVYMGEFGWSIQRLTDDPDEKYSVDFRNLAFREFLTAMRSAGYDGSLVWDFRHSQEWPLTWNKQAVFPRWDSTTSLVEDHYANIATPPGGDSAPTLQSPSISSQTTPIEGRKMLSVSNTGGGTADEPAFSLAAEGDTYTDPDGTNSAVERLRRRLPGVRRGQPLRDCRGDRRHPPGPVGVEHVATGLGPGRSGHRRRIRPGVRHQPHRERERPSVARRQRRPGRLERRDLDEPRGLGHDVRTDLPVGDAVRREHGSRRQLRLRRPRQRQRRGRRESQQRPRVDAPGHQRREIDRLAGRAGPRRRGCGVERRSR